MAPEALLLAPPAPAALLLLRPIVGPPGVGRAPSELSRPGARVETAGLGSVTLPVVAGVADAAAGLFLLGGGGLVGGII